MANYIFEDTSFTTDELTAVADEAGITLNELFEKNPGIKETDPDPDEEGKETPSQETVDAAVEVSDTASKSEDFLSVFQRTSARKKTRQKDLAKIIKKPKSVKQFKPEDFEDDSFIDPKFKLATEGDLFVKDAQRKKEIEGIIEESIDPEIAFQFETELNQIEKRNPNINEAVLQISKDTGGVGDITTLFDFKAAASQEAFEKLDLSIETKGAIIDVLKEKNIPIEKAAQGRLTLEEKEDIITNAKNIVLNKSLENKIQNFTETFSEEYSAGLEKLQYLNNQIDLLSGGDMQMDALDSPNRIEKYNNTVKEYNNLYNTLKQSEENFQSGIEDLQAKYTVDRGEIFVKNFKKSIEKEKAAEDLPGGATTNALFTLLNETYSIVKKGTVAVPQFLIKGAANFADVITDKEEYSMFDAFADQLGVEASRGLGLPQSDKYKLVDDEGNFNVTYGNVVNNIAETLPFSLYILFEAGRGDFKNAKKLLSSGYSKAAKLSPKQIDQLNIVQSAWKATVNDNVKSGEELGLNPIAAQAYGFNLSLAEGLTSLVMPETAYFKGGMQAVEAGLFKNLRNVATKKAAANATKKYFSNIGKELAEEELMAISSDLLRISSGLGTQNNEFTNLIAQKQLIASTILLSGTLGLPGLSRNYNTTKKLVYQDVVNKSNTLLNSMQAEMAALPKDEQGNVLPEYQEQYNALEQARIFTTDLVRATKISPKNVSSDDLDLIIQKERLIKEKAELDTAFHAPINEQIAAIDTQIAESKITTTKAEVGKKLKKGVDVLSKKLGFKITRLKNNKETEDYLNKIAPGKDNVKRAGGFGFFVENPDGTKEIVINEDANKKAGVITTEAHEGLHYILSETLKSNPEAQQAFGNALLNELAKIDQGQIANSEYAQRLQQYLIDPDISDGDALEEALTLFSEATLTGDIVYNENIITKIGDFIRQTLQSVGLEQVVFNEGRDIFNFIKDYNNSIKKGRADKFITDIATKGAVGKLTQGQAVKQAETVIKKSRSKEASNKVQEIYEQKGINGALDIIEQFKPITNKIVDQRKNAPNFDRQLLTDEIETGAGGILDLIQAYDPASNVPLAAYINKFLPVRAITASRRVLGEEFTDDITESVQVAAETAPEVEIEVAETKPTERLIEVKKQVLSESNQKELEDIVAEKLPELTPDQFTFKTLPNWAKQTLAKEINIPVKKFEGSSNFTQAELGRVTSFIENNIDTVRKALPDAAVLEGAPVTEGLIGTATGVPNNLLKDTNLYTRLERGTKKAGLVPFQKNKGIDNSSVLKAIGIIEGKRTAGPRDKQAQTAKGIINVLAKFITNQEIRKQADLTPQQKTDIETGKGSRLLFSKSLSKIFGLSANEAFSFSNISDINSGRIELKDLSSAMIKDVGIQGWIDIIDPVVSRQYKIGDKQLLDNKIGFEALELTEEEFNENKNILLERSTIDGKKRYNQFLTRGRKDYYENILSNAINKEVKWIPREGVEIDGTIYKTPIVPKQTPEGFVNKKAWNASLPERIKFAENQRKGFKKIIQKLTNTYQNSNKSKKDKAKVGMVLNTFNSNINGLIRTAATPGLEFRVEKLNKDSDYRYEHTQPASETLRQLAKIIIGDQNAQTYEETMENFRVAIIPKIYDDIINKVRFDGKLLRSTAPLDENKNLQKPVESTKPTRYEAAAKAIANAGLAPLILTDAIVPSGKAQVKLSKSKSKAAVKNNLELPKSQRLPKGSTNEQVLAKMQELDNEANEARIKFSKSLDLNEDFNNIIEAKTGIATYKRFSPAKAEVRGASKGKFNFFIPPSAEDFTGLLYKTLAKGKVGDTQMQWYKDNLLDPYARAMNDISAARVAMFEDYKALKNDLEIIPKDLKKKSVDEYTREQAVRVYIWNDQGNNVPGLFKTDQKELVDYVNKDSELKLFAEQLIAIQKNDDYSAPKEGWLAGSITTDLLEGVNSIKRKKYLEQWQNNADEIFSDVNMNKLEAAFGKPYRKALENILTRMKTGRNKPFTSDSLAGRVTDWLNNSVGAIMFFNTRSAVLQTISSINFVNWSDNNIYEAGKAFANQPQYWKDFKLLFNSDFLKERRGGLRFNVSESEIADAAKKGGARGVISKILQAGFLPTQMADSFAIASGGATFYRNRVKSYIKEGLTETEAQEKAFLDFREIAEESQQSSRPDRISAQQAGPLGRTILAFANTPAQYARLTKKAASDLINGRGDAKTNISKLLYYGAVQNLIFNTLQQAAFAIAFGDDDENEKKKEEKYISVANGMADGLLRGIGVGGAVIATLKNALIKIIKESEKKRPDYAETTVMQLLGISPPIQSKAQKIRSALKSYEWNKDEMKEKGFSLDNPAYLAGANVISASTNVPLDRVIKKVDNVRAATRDDISKLERMMLLAGWSDWQLGIQPERKPKKKKKTRSSRRGAGRSNNRSSNRR